jgi:hypothetical protein
MTPKEKALEIFNKMYNCELDISYYAAKQCALIAVEEILKSRPKITLSQLYYSDYWQEVKQEIEKL